MRYPQTDDEIVPGVWEHRSLPCKGDDRSCAHARPRFGKLHAYRCVTCMRLGHVSSDFQDPDAVVPLGYFPDAAAAQVKDTNPKDIAATDRPRWHLIPTTALVLEGLAFFEGALKYGANNWMIKGVRASVYAGACASHVGKWWLGEQCDPKTKVHHLASARACLGILLDAEVRGKLTDDRPPRLSEPETLFAHATCVVQGLIELYGEREPKHYTIEDSE